MAAIGESPHRCAKAKAVSARARVAPSVVQGIAQSLSLIEIPKLTPKQNIEAVTMADSTNVAVAMQSSSVASGVSIT